MIKSNNSYDSVSGPATDAAVDLPAAGTVSTFSVTKAMATSAAIALTAFTHANATTSLSTWQNDYQRPDTIVFWADGTEYLSPFMVKEVIEFLRMMPQISIDSVRLLHGLALSFFPGAMLSYENYLDTDTSQPGLRFRVQTQGLDFAQSYAREVAMFQYIDANPSAKLALSHIIISVV